MKRRSFEVGIRVFDEKKKEESDFRVFYRESELVESVYIDL